VENGISPFFTIHEHRRDDLHLRAVIFDYGMVLSGSPDATIMAELVQRSGLPPAQAEALYRKYRRAYDRGSLSGIKYWRQIFTDAGIEKSTEEIARMAALDARMWTVFDPRLLKWQMQLKQAGLKTAILSNMGDMIKESIAGTFPWIEGFDVLIWSYEHRLLKPEPAIYRLALRQLNTEPAETLFIDDVEENVAAARALGIESLPYLGVAHLREQLIALNLNSAIPLPQ
jgi:putative hydrolase of the HAD superfamily